MGKQVDDLIQEKETLESSSSSLVLELAQFKENSLELQSLLENERQANDLKAAEAERSRTAQETTINAINQEKEELKTNVSDLKVQTLLLFTAMIS